MRPTECENGRRASTTGVLLTSLCCLAVACATARPNPGASVETLLVHQVSVPAHPDSAWAVRTATDFFEADDSTVRFVVLKVCDAPNGYFVALMPIGPPGRILIGGGEVFVGFSGRATLIYFYQ